MKPIVDIRTTLLALTIGAGLVTGCSSKTPEVEIKTFVGPSHAQRDPQTRTEHADKVAEVVLAQLMPPAPSKSSSDPTDRDDPVHAPQNAEQMDQIIAAIRKVPLDELDGPARRLAAAGPEVWPQIREGLVAPRKAPKGDYRSLLKAIGGDVPNRYGHFSLSWKKAHGHAVKLSSDWFSDLLSLPSGKISGGLRAVYRDCVVQTAFLRAAANIGSSEPALTGDVVATLLDVAYDFQGTFRDEVGRALVGVGDEAIPYLLVESMPPPGKRRRQRDRDDTPWLRAEYAQLQLDKMDRLHPHRATAAVREDPRLLSRVLHAYGTARPGEAAAVLLEHADAVDPTVRTAARASFIAYVDGPPPPTKGRTIRLLGGGTGRAVAHLNYRERALLAIRERMAGEVPERLEEECEPVREDGSIDRKCEGQAQRLTTEYFAWLEESRQAADAQAIAQALGTEDIDQRVDELDRLLAQNPTLIEGERLIPVYREAADAAAQRGDTTRAGQLWRKSARLAEREDPKQGAALRVEALLAESETPELTAEGRRMLLSSAQSLAPEDPRVHAALVERKSDGPEPMMAARRQQMVPIAGVAAGLWGLGLLGSLWRRRRRRVRKS